MNIIQWNITSYRTNFPELKILIRQENPICICLQETRHGDRILNPPSKYNIIQSPKKRDDDHERGVAILIRKNINYQNVQLTTNLQAVAARIWMGKWYTICTLYLPHHDVTEAELTGLILQLPKPYLILGDMNARHHIWGEPVDNPKGKIFEKLLNHQDLCLLNSSTPTHYHVQTNSLTTIDLSFTSGDCFPDFRHEVLDDLHGSDHYPIRIGKIVTPEASEPSLRFKTEKADWAEFRSLTDRYQLLPDTDDIDLLVNHLTEFIIEAAQSTIPISQGRGGGKIPIPWWNSYCDRVKQDRKRAQRALRRNHSEANLIAYQRTKAVCRRAFKLAASESWVKFTSSININTTLQEVWAKIQKIKGKFSQHPLPLLRNSAGDLTDNPSETSSLFSEAFSSVSTEENYTPTFNRYKSLSERKPINFNSSDEDDHDYNSPLSFEEFSAALSTVKETSPGPDRITYSMIKNCHPTLQERILEIFNKSFINQVFPMSWKIAIIIPIPKPNKDHSTPLNFRPISLTSCLCKLYEKIINQRLMWYLENGKHLSNSQSGFRHRRSTTDCLVQFEQDIRGALARGQHSIAVFFDLKKAYDMAWKYGILQKLHEFGLRGNLPKFIQNFLNNRQIKTKVGNVYSDPVNVLEGVPQGSVLSCTLFAVSIDGAINSLPTEVKSTLYVDDLTIYMSGSSTSLIERRLQIAINHLQKWCDTTGFQFSAPKSVAMHICRVRRCPKAAHQLSLNNSPISCKDSHTFLGLRIDSSLTWEDHIKYLKGDCLKRMNLLKHLSHTSWGADSKSLLRIYTSIVKSKLDYGNEAYTSASPSLLKKLEPIQNQAIRISTGAFKSSPIKSLEVISNTKPLQISQEIKQLNYLTRVIANKSNPINMIINSSGILEDEDLPTQEDLTKLQKQMFTNRAKLLLTKYNLDLTSVMEENPPHSSPWEIGNVSVCQEISKCNKKDFNPVVLKNLFLSHLLQDHNDEYIVYTDGSKTDSGVGFSLVAQDRSISRRLPVSASIYTAELSAIMEAINLTATIPDPTIVIITDSRSSIQGIVKPFSRHPLIQKIQETMKLTGKIYIFCWVPSHINVGGNERADQLARSAILASDADFASCLLPIGDLKAWVKKTAKEKWAQEWRETQPNKLREITSDISPLSDSSCSDRHWERSLVRLRIGHSRLTHGYLMARDERPTCEHCEDAHLTIRHILIECPSHRIKRLRYFGTADVTMQSLLKDGDTSYGGSLYNYLREINIINRL